MVSGTTIVIYYSPCQCEVAAASCRRFHAMQGNVHALQTDKWLAVRGDDSIFALGDAATIVQDRALEHAAELFVQARVASV